MDCIKAEMIMQPGAIILELEQVFRDKAKENQSKAGGDKRTVPQNSAKAIVEPIETRKELATVPGDPRGR